AAMNHRASFGAARRAWFDLTAPDERLWSWPWYGYTNAGTFVSTFNTAANPFPTGFPLATGGGSGVPPTTPGLVLFSSRVQTTSTPTTQLQQNAQQLQDYFATAPVPLVNPYTYPGPI